MISPSRTLYPSLALSDPLPSAMQERSGELTMSKLCSFSQLITKIEKTIERW